MFIFFFMIVATFVGSGESPPRCSFAVLFVVEAARHLLGVVTLYFALIISVYQDF